MSLRGVTNNAIPLGVLPSGATLGVGAFSSPANEAHVTPSLAELEGRGFSLSIPLSLTGAYQKRGGIFSVASIEDRVSALHALVDDPDVAAIVASRGGYGVMEILDRIDYQKVKEARKPFVGFSDFTALLIAISSRAQIPVFHGPMAVHSFQDEQDAPLVKESRDLLFQLLQGTRVDPFEGRTGSILCREGEGTGEIIGGNLAILHALAAADLLPSFKGKLLFLEDVGELPYRIHRLLLSLKMRGAFDGLAGVVLGDFVPPSGVDSSSTAFYEEVFLDIFSDTRFTFPVIHGLPFGHRPLNIPFPLGAKASIVGNRVAVIEKVVG